MPPTRSLSALLVGLSLTSGPLAVQEVSGKETALSILPEKPKQLPAPEQLKLSKRLHAFIVEKTKKDEELKKYEDKVPKAADHLLKLLPIPGGKFLMGSPEDEEDRRADEGPQKTVNIAPFWMSETEITWALYDPFWQNDPDFDKPRNKDGSLDLDNDRYTPDLPDLEKTPVVDAISQPTTQYHDMFVAGQFKHTAKHPAMDMTNHAASKFCQWLSAQTGHFYRLPTEAEWEYACRAGTTTAYSFGDDPDLLPEYGWFIDNGDFTYAEVALKKPNPWGLYDMHGNVAEWTIDGYDADLFKKIADGTANPWNFPQKRYPRVIRGGSWDDDADRLRSAARTASNKDLKIKDPQNPNSVWYHTDAQHVGFRVVRPKDLPSAEEMHLFWNTDFLSVERTQEDF